MKFEEAMKRYGIPIPENIFEYDKEKYREFDNMYLESFYNTFYSKDNIVQKQEDSNKKSCIAVVLGGQVGAGKSSLVSETKMQFRNLGRRIILIDDDQYRSLYPYKKEILQDCPEFFTKITATATSKITPKILKFAAENGYNFIFDGTMKNRRIIETMKTWEGYQIQVKIMAASRLRSLLSIALRNGELRARGEGRFITNEAHDETYSGIPETLNYLQSIGLASEIKIYSRGNNPQFPIEQFSTSNESNVSIGEQLEKLRKKDEEQFLKEAPQNIEYLKSLIVNLSEDEKNEAYKSIEMIENAMDKRGYEGEEK